MKKIALLLSERCSRIGAVTVCLVVTIAGCKDLGSHRLTCNTPYDFERVVVTERTAPVQTVSQTVIPAEPAALSVDRPDSARWHMPLDKAIAIALSRNRDLLVTAHSPQIASHAVTSADSMFDPLLQAGGGWRRSETQITNVVDGPGGATPAAATDLFGPPQGLSDQLRLSKATRLGGQVSANFGTAYSMSEPGGTFLRFNPVVTSTLSFHVDQPLFQGAGREVNTINIRVARQMQHASLHTLDAQVRSTVSSVVAAYWGLYGSVAELVAMDMAVHQGKETWDKEIEKLGLGASSKTDVAEAREQLERFRARQVLARKAVADSERALRGLLGLEHEDGSRIVPITLPVKDQVELHWDAAVREAMNTRPELAGSRSMLKAARLEVDRADDNLRPDVKAYAGYSLSGSAGSFDRSVEIVAENDFASWWMGFVYEKRLGRRLECAAKHQANLGLSRQLREVERTRQRVLTELHEAYQAVSSSWEVIQRQRDRRDAAATVLEARKAMYDVGEISLDLYLRATAAWSMSMAEERNAVARYNSALARWEFARGTILETFRVEMEAYDPAASDGDPDGQFLRDYMNPPDDEEENEAGPPNAKPLLVLSDAPQIRLLTPDFGRVRPVSQPEARRATPMLAAEGRLRRSLSYCFGPVAGTHWHPSVAMILD